MPTFEETRNGHGVEWIETREADESLNVRYFLEPDGGPRYRTVVEDGVDREEIGRKTLSIAEVATLPGAAGSRNTCAY